MLNLKNVVLSLFLYLLLTPVCFSQSNSGTEFWIAFNKIPWEKEEQVYVYICSELPAKGVIIIESMKYEKQFVSHPGELITIEIPRKALVDTNETISGKGIHIQSDRPITVFGLNYQQFGSDGFLALPLESLGKKYYAMCYPGDMPSEILVVSTENNTKLNIEPSSELMDGKISPFEVRLNAGQTYLLKSKPGGDLTGTFIQSSDPIAVFSGNMGCFIPNSRFCCANHLVEQIPPLKLWGKQFITAPLALKSRGDIYRIMACKDETEIYIDNNLVTKLDKGRFFETFLPSNKGFEITSSLPVLVSQFSTSYQYDSVGFTDPFMLIISPVEQYSISYLFATPKYHFDSTNYINVLIKSNEIPRFALDNQPISDDNIVEDKDFYSISSIRVKPGMHTIRSTNGKKFGLSVYGYNNYDGYGYLGGMGLKESNCDIFEEERQSVGLSLCYPFAYGAQYEIGYKNYNLVAGYLYAPNVGKFDGTPPPDSLNQSNYQHNIFFSPSYLFQYNCNLYFFAGAYMALGFRSWKNLPNLIGLPDSIKTVQSGNFIEYYLGVQVGLKYFIFENIYLGIAASLNFQTTHRFNDQIINGTKPGGALFFSLNYTF